MSRICICSDRVGGLGPVSAGTALARAFARARPGRDQVALVPFAAGGADLASALGALGRPAVVIAPGDPHELGPAVTAALQQAPERLVVDLAGLGDVGPAVLPVVAEGLGLAGVGSRAAPGGATELVVLVPPDEASEMLLGVSGLSARRGYAEGRSVAEVLTADAELAAWASRLGVADAPGMGAAGGLPLLLCALGARLSTGVAECRAAAGLDDTLARADLLVVGIDAVHAGNFGGPVLLGLAPLALELGVPCLAVARAVGISSRELRRHGVEAAHAVGEAAMAGEAELTAASTPIARTWLG